MAHVVPGPGPAPAPAPAPVVPPIVNGMPVITQAEAAEYFTEALSMLIIWDKQALVSQGAIDLQNDSRFRAPNQLSDAELKTIIKNMLPGLYSAVGAMIYVYPWERYKKLCIQLGQQGVIPNADLAASQAFDVSTWNEVNFRTEFALSKVLRWAPPQNANPRWPAECIRNSFAHGQSRVVLVPGPQPNTNVYLIEIWNSPNGNFANSNFHIQMEPSDFLRMARRCITAFCTNAVQNQRLDPLQKLLAHLV